jgi:acyl-CoA reductase-like NAD-dependent aldehyde dehydrogenase
VYRKWKVGDPSDPETKMGPLISKEHRDKVKGYIAIARQEGANILCGDGVDELVLPESNRNGYFVLPTVITGVSDESRLMKEEVFGPLVCIVPFKTEDEVIARANNVDYGLAASVWCQNMGVLTRVSQALQVGTVWANCWMVRSMNVPFGGVKMSGLGREGLEDSKDFYTEKKTICIKY